MKLLVDAQLPPALARWLDEQFDASHVKDLGLESAPDSAIWDRALADAAIIVTKDEGFATRRVHQRSGPTIVWVRFGNTTTREVLARFERLMPSIREAIDRGEPIVEIV